MFNHRGFSLIELIVVIVILSILGLMSFSFLGNSMATYMLVKDGNLIYDEGLMALERMTREIRDARHQPPTYTLTPGTNSITFTRKHPTPQDNSTNIIFRINGNQELERVGDVSGTHILAGHVTSFSPTLFPDPTDPNGKTVKLELGLEINSGGTTIPVVLHSSATARN